MYVYIYTHTIHVYLCMKTYNNFTTCVNKFIMYNRLIVQTFPNHVFPVLKSTVYSIHVSV